MVGRLAMPAMVGALSFGQAALAETYKGYEMPPFEVVQRIGAVEVRDYAPHVVAEVRVEGGKNRAASKGFRTLAGYIFGGNATGEKIAMTVPVTQVPEGKGAWAVRFMMPRSAVAQGLPAAKDGAIEMYELQGGREAVLAFSGWATDAVIARATRQLRAALVAEGFSASGEVRVYYYDDPMTLPWKRRNEVALSLQ